MAKGGKREGAGRPKGRRNKATIEQRGSLEELARSHTEAALTALVAIASGGESEAARVSAAIAILDRGYGKPRQSVELGGPDGGPIETADVTGRESFERRIAGVAARFGTGEASSKPH